MKSKYLELYKFGRCPDEVKQSADLSLPGVYYTASVDVVVMITFWIGEINIE